MWASEAPCSSISKNQMKCLKPGHHIAKILLFRTHHPWSSTTELILGVSPKDDLRRRGEGGVSTGKTTSSFWIWPFIEFGRHLVFFFPFKHYISILVLSGFLYTKFCIKKIDFKKSSLPNFHLQKSYLSFPLKRPCFTCDISCSVWSRCSFMHNWVKPFMNAIVLS